MGGPLKPLDYQNSCTVIYRLCGDITGTLMFPFDYSTMYLQRIKYIFLKRSSINLAFDLIYL